MNGRNNVGSSHNRYRPETKVPALLRVWRRIGGARRHRFAPSGTSTLHDSVALFCTAARRRSRTAVADSAGPAGDRRTTQERRSCRDDSSDAIRKLQLYIRPGYRPWCTCHRWVGIQPPAFWQRLTFAGCSCVVRVATPAGLPTGETATAPGGLRPSLGSGVGRRTSRARLSSVPTCRAGLGSRVLRRRVS